MGKNEKIDLTEQILESLNQDVAEPTPGELLDDAMSENGGATMGFFKQITSKVDLTSIWDGLWETNKDASMDVLGAKISHVTVTLINETAKSLVPDNTEFGKVIRSKLVNVIMYGVLSQGIVVAANALTPVHPKFSFIAQGAARNSIQHTAGALNLVNTMFGQTHPMLKKFFG